MSAAYGKDYVRAGLRDGNPGAKGGAHEDLYLIITTDCVAVGLPRAFLWKLRTPKSVYAIKILEAVVPFAERSINYKERSDY